MNAIQYFDWGGIERIEIVPIVVIVKDFFVKPIGAAIVGLIPIQKDYKIKFLVAKNRHGNGLTPIVVERYELHRISNDLVLKYFLKNKNLKNIEVYYLDFGIYLDRDYPYFPDLRDNYGTFYINGRKVKNQNFAHNRVMYNKVGLRVQVTSSLGIVDTPIQYEDGEIITLKKLIGKEIVLTLN